MFIGAPKEIEAKGCPVVSVRAEVRILESHGHPVVVAAGSGGER